MDMYNVNYVKDADITDISGIYLYKAVYFHFFVVVLKC
jgi:hypothetical protein